MKNLKIIQILGLIIMFGSCKTPQNQASIDLKEINTFLDQWHHAAAIADQETFFNSFAKDAIYIGTDPTEYWQAQELKTIFKYAFDRESAWAFTPHNRHIYIANDKKTIWFDELLKTWMGPCRGSGVLTLENGRWKIAHYHLSIAVPNEATDTYIKILKDKHLN